jgi:hypothetical protein
MDIQQLKGDYDQNNPNHLKITDFPLHRVKTFHSTAGKDYVRITNFLILKEKETNRIQFVIQNFAHLKASSSFHQ